MLHAQELRNSRADIWYIRFGLNFDNTLLATGSRDGKMYLAKLSHSARRRLGCLPPRPPTRLL